MTEGYLVITNNPKVAGVCRFNGFDCQYHETQRETVSSARDQVHLGRSLCIDPGAGRYLDRMHPYLTVVLGSKRAESRGDDLTAVEALYRRIWFSPVSMWVTEADEDFQRLDLELFIHAMSGITTIPWRDMGRV
jgi:hypothetical protein